MYVQPFKTGTLWENHHKQFPFSEDRDNSKKKKKIQIVSLIDVLNI